MSGKIVFRKALVKKDSTQKSTQQTTSQTMRSNAPPTQSKFPSNVPRTTIPIVPRPRPAAQQQPPSGVQSKPTTSTIMTRQIPAITTITTRPTTTTTTTKPGLVSLQQAVQKQLPISTPLKKLDNDLPSSSSEKSQREQKTQEEKKNEKQQQQQEQKSSSYLKMITDIVKEISVAPKRHEKIGIASKEVPKMCYFIGYEENNKKQQIDKMTMSWCLLDPKTSKCTLTFCFDVGDVRKYIDEYTESMEKGALVVSSQGGEEKQQEIQKRVNPPMYRRDEIIKALGDRTDIIVPERMTDEFLFAVQTFDSSVSQEEQGRLLSTDLYGRIIIDIVQKFILEKIGTVSEVDGVFWKYTKTALRYFAVKSTNIAVWILRNPFWVSVIKIVAKIIRIGLCVHSSFPTNQVDTIIKTLQNEFKKQLTGVGFGIPLYIVETGLLVTKCLKNFGTINVTGVVSDCVVGGFFHLIGVANIFAKIIQSVVDFSLTRYLVSTIDSLTNHPDEVLGIFLGDINAGIAQDVRYIVQMNNFTLHNWNRVAFLLVLQYIPIQYIIKVIYMIAKLFPQFLPVILALETAAQAIKSKLNTISSNTKVQNIVETIVNSENRLIQMFKGLNFMQLVTQVLQYQDQHDAIVGLLEELSEWFFDLIPCIFSSFVRKIKCIFGDPSSCQTETYVPCCMAKIITSIQDQISSYFSSTTKAKAINAVLSGLKNIFTLGGIFSSAAITMTPEIQTALAELVANNPSILDDDENMQKALEKIADGTIEKQTIPKDQQDRVVQKLVKDNALDESESKSLKQALFGENETEHFTAKDPIPTELYNAFSPEGEARLWASLSDEREKRKVFEKPLYTLILDDGTRIPFYLFVWNDGAVFEDGHKMHVSVMAQEIAKHYPNAIFEFRGRYFVLLGELPREVVKHMILFSNPIVDLTRI